MAADNDEYGINRPVPTLEIPAPVLRYRPRDPRLYQPAIGLIGCGGITEHHLRAYMQAGYRVTALCDLHPERAETRRQEFFPEATVFTDYADLLKQDVIDVVDIATHPTERAPIIEAALLAGKHVLSQKPFVVDLDVGERLADLADRQGVLLAVNQNGRWAPHFSYARAAIREGMLGDLLGAHLSVHWDHNWISGTEFDNVHHVALYDFGIHWFDIVTQFFGSRPARRVFASLTSASGQTARPPLLAQALIEYEGGQASLVFDASTRFGTQDWTCLTGTRGTLTSVGPDLGSQKVTLYRPSGWSSPDLLGSWFPDGFHGSMSELLCAIEEGRQPSNNARDNLRSLALCFAALASADSGQPRAPGEVRTMA
jgi:predicted dehydrogenase